LTVSGDLTVDTSTLKVDSTNNRVGIGTASPVYTLDVQGGRALHTDNSDVYAIGVRNRASLAPNGNYWIGATNATSPDMVFSNNAGTERMRLTDAGNLAVDTNTLYVDAANNRVGIGTASPGSTFEVAGGQANFTQTSANSRILVTAAGVANTVVGFNNSGGTVTGMVNNVGYVNVLQAYPLVFGTDSVERMRLDASGNLGLGVTPSAWSGLKGLQVADSTMLAYAGTSGYVGSNSYYGSAGGSGFKYYGNGLAALYAQEAGVHKWFNAPNNTSGAGAAISFTQAMTLDASGNLGVGTASPDTRIQAAATGAVGISARANTSGDPFFRVYLDSTIYGHWFADRTNANVTIGSVANVPLVLVTNNTERARITSGGWSKFADNGAYVNSAGDYHEFSRSATSTTPVIIVWNKLTTSDNSFIQFGTEGSYTSRGDITYNRGAGLVAYNTTSDYRAKDILGSIEDSGATIDALRVYMGQMHGATIARPMLIAHEAQAVTPYAVTGEKDAVREESYEVTPAEKDEDGNVIAEAVMGVREVPVYQQMDHSAYVPLLIAEIQSLRARVAALEA
jgi:hypothetical protein